MRASGLVIHLGAHRRLGEGVYSVVCEVEGRALKLFKRYPQFPPKQTEEGRRLVFQHQCRAYEKAAHDPFVKNHIATCFGPCVIDDVLDADEKQCEGIVLAGLLLRRGNHVRQRNQGGIRTSALRI